MMTLIPRGTDRIAGELTPQHWRLRREKLLSDADEDLWRRSYEDFFVQRVSFRYLEPIRVLQENGAMRGEGFSIVAIQCTLIEFIEATLQGATYRHLRKGQTLGAYEYSASGQLFESFLTSRHPFAAFFDRSLAHEFYVGVRCALLHEARTKGWRIWAYDPVGRLVCREELVVFRDEFQKALVQFVDTLGKDLLNDAALQQAFIRKMDSLCE